MKATQLFDHHMHSEFSGDSSQSMEELVQNAIKDEKKFITFTEHSDLVNPGIFCADIPAYTKRVKELQAQYPEITILRGSEIGFEKVIIPEIKDFMATHQFDITVLSVHSILGGKDFADEMRAYGEWRHSDDLVLDFFQANLDAVTLIDSAQILGHLDYLLRYVENGANLDISPYDEIFTAIFEQLIKKDMALDFNTAGIRYGLPFAHPQPALLKRYKEAGGKYITLGSDAHFAKDVNFGFKDAISLLSDIGFDSITTYEMGYPEQIPFRLITE